ncbi:hypothetical protein IscW_ISCW023697 [Ixodes scapularis]|uniref:Secreted protein n=1 Tax=Ixodes scapularis TaxID=6945 RepID=B7QLF3_IXOSC|nr:hypothetical protein IscW_ISCW023697 [Ixodes scapularis]|eukprot:XP_002416008.1 hypothetical protein IscW_ISCW023697 [Ixodes scapularis]
MQILLSFFFVLTIKSIIKLCLNKLKSKIFRAYALFSCSKKKRKKVQLRGVGSLASYQVHLCSNGHAPLAKALFSLNESPQLVFLPLGAVLLYALTVGSRAIEMEMWPI